MSAICFRESRFSGDPDFVPNFRESRDIFGRYSGIEYLLSNLNSKYILFGLILILFALLFYG